MKRTISVMTGKGSVNHNSRKFHAKNTDPERSCLNVEYCNENIKDVYHELFDEALARYNEKQTRSDRIIDDYYEKICFGKQEKPFHEIILQIGNKDDMGAKTEDGQLAAKILDEYMQDFQRRNPTLRVFSAHLHMDEATPHLHIDFVPYTTGSKRGLETRVGCFLPQKVLLISREDTAGLAPNRCLPGKKGYISGTFLLCGVPEEGCNFASLTAGQQKEFQDIFARPGEFMMVAGTAYADPDDVADIVYGLWDSLSDGDTVVLTKWGGIESGA